MTISASDINFFYSGGSNNLDPTKSIGGKASVNLIEGIANSIFTDVTDVAGLGAPTSLGPDGIDYRCFYIFNTSELYSLYEASIYVLQQSGTGDVFSNITLGLSTSTEVQNLNISLTGTPASGSFKLQYETSTTDSIPYSSDSEQMANNIQRELNRLSVLGGNFSGVVVNASSNSDFLISFLGGENNRNHELLTATNLNITPAASISISEATEGQPINSEAPLLPNSLTTPFGVVFSDTFADNPISIGDLRPGDGVPIWIKRETTGSGTSTVDLEFKLRISGKSIPPAGSFARQIPVLDRSARGELFN